MRKKEVNIVEDGWLDGMLETHCHLLPGVDDGVRSLEESRALLQVMQSVGIRQFIFTPHIHGRYPKNSSLTLPGQFHSYLTRASARTHFDGIFEELTRQHKNTSHQDLLALPSSSSFTGQEVVDCCP